MELTLAEVAVRLGVSRRTLRRRIVESGLAFPKPGRSYVLNEEDYKRLREELRCRGSSSRQESAREIPTGSCEGPIRSAAEALRSARKRERKRLLKNLRQSTGESFAQVVHLDLERK